MRRRTDEAVELVEIMYERYEADDVFDVGRAFMRALHGQRTKDFTRYDLQRADIIPIKKRSPGGPFARKPSMAVSCPLCTATWSGTSDVSYDHLGRHLDKVHELRRGEIARIVAATRPCYTRSLDEA